MNTERRKALDAEMAAAILRYRKGQLDQAFKHLEVAHVLSQRYVVPHVVSHWWMLNGFFVSRLPRSPFLDSGLNYRR